VVPKLSVIFSIVRENLQKFLEISSQCKISGKFT